MNVRKNQRRPSDVESIEATAAAWLAEQDGGLNERQSAEFAEWRGRDVRHEAAVQRLEATWRTLQQLRDFRPDAARHPDRDLLEAPAGRPRGQRFRPRFTALGVAASLLFAALLWPVVHDRVGRADTQHYATAVNGYERVTLDDGSVIELNAESEASIRFTAEERRVHLVRGEGHFTVAKDSARPFTVRAGAVAVTAVGTAFNVKLAPEKVEVLVTEGRVSVAPGAASASLPLPARAAEPTTLGVYERAVVERTAAPSAPPVVEKIGVEAVRQTLGWQKPRLIFVDTPLADVVAQLNRENPVQLVIVDPELGTMPVGGSLRAENVDTFLRLLEGGDVLIDRSEPGRVLLRKAK